MTLDITRLCHYAERRILFTVVLNVVLLNVVILSVIMLSAIMVSVVAPFHILSHKGSAIGCHNGKDLVQTTNNKI
jgi:nitrate/nitrite-specific signal transduction histidine kinase